MIPRAARLYFLSLTSFFHRLRYDFARECVIGLCSVVLGALFYYIFNDFLHTEALALSDELRSRLGGLVALLLLTAVSLASGYSLRRERFSRQSLAGYALRLGEEPATLLLYWALRAPTVLALFYLPAWYLCLESFITLPSYVVAGTTLLMLGTSLAIVSTFKPTRQSKPEIPNQKDPTTRFFSHKKSAITAMVFWKLRQLFWRHRLAQFCLLLSLAVSSLLLSSNTPPPLEFLFAFTAGLLISLALALQISQDLKCSWIEKNLGISHERYLAGMIIFSHGVGGLFAITAFFFSLLGQGIHQGLGLTWALSLMFILWTPAFLLPFLTLQIDGRRPAIQMLSVTLASLFVATAVYASLYSLLLFPLIAYYGLVSQKGRFYRA